MRVPPFYIACAVMFWAWHAGVLVLGVAMALVVEAPRVLRMRWQFAQSDFARIADFCIWAFLILSGYLTFTLGFPVPILEIFRWAPLLMLPLVAAQLFSESGRVPLRALFLTLRLERYARLEDPGVDLGYPYVIACALAAGAANQRHDAYYLGLMLLLGWGLWRVRPTRYPWFVWVIMFTGAGAIGYAGQLGLSRLQQIVIDSAESMFAGGSRIDPYKSTTNMGEIGELKQSGRIVLRVTAPPGTGIPLLVHTANYNAYAAPSWLAFNVTFSQVFGQPDGKSWQIADTGSAVSRSITVSQPVERGKALLALPNGTLKVGQLPVTDMQRNGLGTVEIDSREDLATFQASFDPAAARDKPQSIDLTVPHNEAVILGQIAARLRLTGAPPREALAILRQYFEREFHYSTYLTTSKVQETPLADFLLVTHTGHCEYFATATTLLLRAAGVPARYATGYSVQEWSPLEERYIARERHAHAWAQAWIDGRWVDFDTTPPVWFAAEAEGASWTQKLADLWSWASYRFALWEAEEPNARTITALVLVFPLTAILIWRLLIQQPLAIRRANRLAVAARREQPGADSEFYLVETRLARAGLARGAGESLGAWLARIGRERADIAVAPLQELLRLHYRYRFDPLGLDAAERRALGAQARSWLQAHSGLAAARPPG
jgi:hypothetical protein